MISYTTRYINIVSTIITIIIYLFLSNIHIIKNSFDFYPLISKFFKINSIFVELKSDNINQETNDNKKNDCSNANDKKEISWKITIPKIVLEAEISEGTNKEVLDNYVGHFEETSKLQGNIGLAAHNRGYKVNYFSNIKDLKKGDEIIYKYNNIEKVYIVAENKIIKDTDWKDLEKTKENKITLITCVENEPEYRRCIQGIQKEEGGY